MKISSNIYWRLIIYPYLKLIHVNKLGNLEYVRNWLFFIQNLYYNSDPLLDIRHGGGGGDKIAKGPLVVSIRRPWS